MSAASHPPDPGRTVDFRWAPDNTWTLIGLPDDRHKTLVREDGALLYGFKAAAFDDWRFERVIEFGAQTTHRAVRVSQRTESARRPIVVTEVEYPRQILELTTFSTVVGGARVDVTNWKVSAKVDSGELAGGLTLDCSLTSEVLATTSITGPHYVVHPVPSTPWPQTPSWTDDLPYFDPESAPGRRPGWSVQSLGIPLMGRSARGFRPVSALMTEPVLLGAGETVAGSIVVCLETPSDSSGLLPLTEASWAARELESRRAFWDALDLGAGLPSVPDEGIQDILVASARNMIQARELENGLPVLQVGPTIYRGLWLVDGHFMLETARYLGWDDVADAGIDVLLRRVRDDGSIIQLATEPHLKETAVGISTIVRQTELTGDLERLVRLWPVVAAAVRFIKKLRADSMKLPQAHPFYGLVPEGFADGGLGGLRAEHTTVAWIMIGLRYAASGAKMLGKFAESADYEAELQDMKAVFARRAEIDRIPATPTVPAYLPMVAPGSGMHQFHAGLADHEVPWLRRIQPETATWSMCHAMWPGEVFSQEDQVVRDLLGLMDARDDVEGIPATTGWLPWQAVWSYYASFAAHAWLFAHRPDKAADYLYAFANHASVTRVWREEQPLAGTGNLQICGDMPHNWASAEFIRLVRHMLVFERGQGLDLLAGVPEHWWHAGQQIVLPPSPTRFGAIGLQLNCDASGADLHLSRGASSDTSIHGTISLPAGASGATVSRASGSGAARLPVSGDGRVEVELPANQRVQLRIDFTQAS